MSSYRTPQRTGTATTGSVISSSGSADLAETRRRQNKRDEAIRKKIESELSRKRPSKRLAPGQSGGRPGQLSNRRPQAGTVSALKPLPALTVPDSITVSDASQLCAAKRTDCVLVVDDDEHLCGIFTAKDLAFRVIGDGLDPRATLVSQIMTPNPMVTRDTTSATDALQTMVSHGFRHLPVCNEEGDVVGLLDITKVFHESLEKLERAHGSSQKLYSALEGVQTEFGGGGPPAAHNLIAYVEALREKMSFPDLGSILDARTAPATVGVKTTVRDAAKLMRERRTTAVCVMENDGKKIAGIFTSKDVVLRVIAAGLDARTCSVVRVMTPHPDTATQTMTIQAALRKMHDGRYLNLPIVDETTQLIGIVDVLKLTYATLEQINTIGAEHGGADDGQSGPLWGRFFASLGATADNDSESVLSDHHSAAHPPHTPTSLHRTSVMPDSPEVYPNDSASVNFDDDRSDLALRSGRTPGLGHHGGHASSVGGLQQPIQDDGTYLFKFVSPGGTTHRFQARYDSYELLQEIISGKLGSDPFFTEKAAAAIPAPGEAVGYETEKGPGSGKPRQAYPPSPSDFKVFYTDDDGDLVLITTDRDVTDAVTTAKKQFKDRVVLRLKGGQGWEDAMDKAGKEGKDAKSALRESVTRADLEEEQEDEEKARRNKRKGKGAKAVADEELVFGVLPKEHVLPASIALLAVTIVGVFALSRTSSR